MKFPISVPAPREPVVRIYQNANKSLRELVLGISMIVFLALPYNSMDCRPLTWPPPDKGSRILCPEKGTSPVLMVKGF